MDISPHIEIDRFTSGSMSPEESSHFLSRLQTDNHLKELFDADSLLTTTIEHQTKTFLQHDLAYTAINFTESLHVAPAVSSSTHALFSSLKGITVAKVVIGCSLIGIISYVLLHNTPKDINTLKNESISWNQQHPMIHTLQTPKYIESKDINSETSTLKILKPRKTVSPVISNKQIQLSHSKKIFLENSHSRFRKKIEVSN